ncbi:MAG: hypothetical protein KDD10_21320 [Phaeodactylibacter sp.]|nr:hypothetical protein [Phaeodactylibacter sp.]MCB9293002.1 hypothetical protein [Lewinellaceae bacterium]
MTDEQIQDLIRFFPSRGEADLPQLVETHISWVILTGKWAFKLKKPVKFDFLDFSTLEKRRYYCQEEVRLNNRLTQGVYLGVVPVVKTKEGLRLEQEGEVVDYAVKMNRLDNSRQMNKLLEKGEVHPAHMEALAEQLAAFHLRADVVEKETGPEAMKEDFANLEAVKPCIEKKLGSEAGRELSECIAFAGNFLDKLAPRMAERARQGCIVDGHGDLHSRNIFLLPEPVIFDCIEFNPHFRQVDVLDELAFLCMDLDFHGARHLEEPFLQTYLRENPRISEDADWAIFSYYKWYRANVRLKVNALRAMEEENPEAESAVEEYWQLFTTYYHSLMEEWVGQV